jgi:hypothetical protein
MPVPRITANFSRTDCGACEVRRLCTPAKYARSIKHQITIAKLPRPGRRRLRLRRDAINETLVRDLASGNFIPHQRNAVLIGRTGMDKTYLAIAIVQACIRGSARGRFFNVVDLVNMLEAEGVQASRAACPSVWSLDKCSATAAPRWRLGVETITTSVTTAVSIIDADRAVHKLRSSRDGLSPASRAAKAGGTSSASTCTRRSRIAIRRKVGLSRATY